MRQVYFVAAAITWKNSPIDIAVLQNFLAILVLLAYEYKFLIEDISSRACIHSLSAIALFCACTWRLSHEPDGCKMHNYSFA